MFRAGEALLDEMFRHDVSDDGLIFHKRRLARVSKPPPAAGGAVPPPG